MDRPEGASGEPAGDAARPPSGTREGRDCAYSQETTRRLLFTRGRPQPWLLVLLAVCLLVLVRVAAS